MLQHMEHVPLGAFTPTDCCLKYGVPVYYRIPALCTPPIPVLGTCQLHNILPEMKSLLALRSIFHTDSIKYARQIEL